jgi:hypothetical protein
MGKKVGEKATYSLPNGRASTVKIPEPVPYVLVFPSFAVSECSGVLG